MIHFLPGTHSNVIPPLPRFRRVQLNASWCARIASGRKLAQNVHVIFISRLINPTLPCLLAMRTRCIYLTTTILGYEGIRLSYLMITYCVNTAYCKRFQFFQIMQNRCVHKGIFSRNSFDVFLTSCT